MRSLLPTGNNFISSCQQVFSTDKQDDVHLNYMPLPVEVSTVFCCVQKILHIFRIDMQLIELVLQDLLQEQLYECKIPLV